jgi:hypothetical protein
MATMLPGITAEHLQPLADASLTSLVTLLTAMMEGSLTMMPCRQRRRGIDGRRDLARSLENRLKSDRML